MTNMEKAYDLAAIAVRRRLYEQRPADLSILESIRAQDVAVYTGAHDQVQHVLSRTRIGFELDPKHTNAKILFANCNSTRNVHLDEPNARVEAGAWLVTSDWSLSGVVEGNFPNTVKRSGSKSTGDEVIGVEPMIESLWQDVVVLGIDPQWWLEGGSYPIEILDPERVRIEAASHEMLQKFGAPVVAVQFHWGKGHVFHVISHFWLKRSRTPNARYQRPCTDFLREGMKLSDEGVGAVVKKSKIDPSTIDFASLQSAATATELVAQLCIRAMKS